MVPDHWKPLKPMVERPKNHWKTIDVNGQSTQKHSMVMISSKTIENWNGLSKTIEVFNGLFKFMENSHGFLNLKWTFVNKYCEIFPVLFLELMILLIIILSPLLQVHVLSQVEFTHFLLHWIFQTIVDHCPLKSKNHRKTIKVSWSKNIQWWWFNAGKTIEKPLMPMVPWKKTLTIPSL